MAFDLGELIEPLSREISPPGTNLYPNAREEELFGHLRDAFWRARLYGLLEDWTQDTNGSVTPIDEEGDEIGGEYQSLVVLFAGFRILLTSLQNMKSAFKAQAGPVAYETQKSAQVAAELLKAKKEEIGYILKRLREAGSSSTVVFDAVIERSYSMAIDDVWWVR